MVDFPIIEIEYMPKRSIREVLVYRRRGKSQQSEPDIKIDIFWIPIQRVESHGRFHY